MSEIDSLNTRVTAAIETAEDLTEDAAKAWREVEAVERALYCRLPAEGVEGRLARRGATAARLKAEALEALS